MTNEMTSILMFGITSGQPISGVTVEYGTLGTPYMVQLASRYQQLHVDIAAPNLMEHDVYVVDLRLRKVSTARGRQRRPVGEPDLWAKCDLGYIDPRVAAAIELSSGLERAIKNGAALVVFCGADAQNRYVEATHLEGMSQLIDMNEVSGTLCERLVPRELRPLRAKEGQGKDIRWATQAESDIMVPLTPHLAGARYECTLVAHPIWQTLLQDRFGDVVGMWARVGETERKGLVLLLPQFNDNGAAATCVVTEVLPRLSPHLFPALATHSWTNKAQYELPAVLRLMGRKQEIVEKAEADLAAIDREVTVQRSADGWRQSMLTETGDALAGAVAKALHALGVNELVDVDAIQDEKHEDRREDFLLRDESHLIVVDVKGIAGLPSDDDVMQAAKHVVMRMRSEGRVDVVGLSLINHQRHLPPLDRENTRPFRAELVEAAEAQGVAALTTWELLRLILASEENGWPTRSLWDALKKGGRPDLVPGFLTSIGSVAHVWERAIGIVPTVRLAVGDTVYVRLAPSMHPRQFVQHRPETLMIDGKGAAAGDPGQNVGLARRIRS